MVKFKFGYYLISGSTGQVPDPQGQQCRKQSILPQDEG